MDSYNLGVLIILVVFLICATIVILRVLNKKNAIIRSVNSSSKDAVLFHLENISRDCEKIINLANDNKTLEIVAHTQLKDGLTIANEANKQKIKHKKKITKVKK